MMELINKVVIGDGSALQVTHVGFMSWNSLSKSFFLHNTLYVPDIHKNLVFVHHFTHSNNVYIKFHLFYFFVKDRNMGTTLLHGECQDGFHPLPKLSPINKPSVLALIGEQTLTDLWYKCFGYPSNKIYGFIINHISLPVLSSRNPLLSICLACQCNKIHKLSFSKTSFISTHPLEYIYIDI